MVATCECGQPYWHPYELERGWCNYCETTRRDERLRGYWSKWFANSPEIREAFAASERRS